VIELASLRSSVTRRLGIDASLAASVPRQVDGLPDVMESAAAGRSLCYALAIAGWGGPPANSAQRRPRHQWCRRVGNGHPPGSALDAGAGGEPAAGLGKP